MSWVTIIWSMVASACLTLAAVYFLVWLKNRAARAQLLFAVTAASTGIFAFFSLWMMRAETPQELDLAIRSGHVPLMVWLISLTWFVRLYLEAGRAWLAWTISGLRLLFVLPILVGQNPTFLAIPSLQHVQFLGESLTVNRGVPNPWTLLGLSTVLLTLIFVADASIAAWTRGDRRKALIIGGSVEFFLFTGLLSSVSLFWVGVNVPHALSLYNLGLVAVMGYELSRDLLRASQLVQELRATETGLRENQAMLQASHKQISDLLGRLMVAQETERTRIARDLHDDVSQRIAVLSIALSGIKRMLRDRPDNSDVMLALTTMQRNTIALAGEIQQVAHALHPGILEHLGLVAALSSFCAEFEKVQSIAVTFRAGDDIGHVEADTALCLYRITQEALHNVVKHAVARRVGVTLMRTATDLQLSIADDGKGFDLADTRGQSAGLGLVSIDERVRLLRGSVHIETYPRGGTCVQIQIPRPPDDPPPNHASQRVTTLVNDQITRGPSTSSAT